MCVETEAEKQLQLGLLSNERRVREWRRLCAICAVLKQKRERDRLSAETVKERDSLNDQKEGKKTNLCNLRIRTQDLHKTSNKRRKNKMVPKIPTKKEHQRI
jgi:hypothetical protein